MASETAVISENMFGEKLYQQRARAALPLLVRQAHAHGGFRYAQLAEELGMPNPRNLNYVLGSVGQTLIELSSRWGEKIPPIQCLVVNGQNGIPGEGFGWFMPESNWRKLSKRQRQAQVQRAMHEVYAYPRWSDVLLEFGLQRAQLEVTALLADAARAGGGGEGEAHRELKMYVAANPWVVGLGVRGVASEVEHRLPSGDSIDVFFCAADEVVAVEIKPAGAPVHDLVRGLFQCVKYRAVLEAVCGVEQADVAVRSVLVIGSILPELLVPLRNTLGVDVVERVVPRRPKSTAQLRKLEKVID